MAAVVLSAVNSARNSARAAAIKMEARQLFTLAQMHYAQYGNFAGSPTDTRFINTQSWLKNDLDTTGSGATRCSDKFYSNNYYDEAVTLCNSITSKLMTNRSDGRATGKLLVGCSDCDSKNDLSVSVKIENNNLNEQDSSNSWFCIGTSGATFEGSGSWNSIRGNPGCWRAL